jgi:asparagine synthase (glutamine-hydrolysing)
MCGIVGLLDPTRSRPAEATEELLAAMARPVHPRGPDGAGAFVDADGGIGLGHRRLAVIDLSEHGHQPMSSADGRYVITYNGEIYDHDVSRADLAAQGVRFRGHSDTEVLVEAIAAWGLETALDRMDGMFAFGLWDRGERTLTLVRDRLGEKPLFYGTVGREVVFGSSLDSLRAHPGFDRPIDLDALALYFRHKYVPAPRTIYQGIAKLAPGCLVTISADGGVGEPRAYWSHCEVVERGRTFSGSLDDAVDELDALLRRSVRRRMVADVPVGAFLSGGIDSSTVVATAQAESSRPVRTFTIGAETSDFDESEDAERVAKHLGTDHTSLLVTGADALAAVELVGGMYDEPFGDSSQIPTRLVSELARREVTVALSGDAGDELFGGYTRYAWVPAIWGRLERVPLGLRRAVAGPAGRVPPGVWDAAAVAIPKRRRPRQLGLKVTKALDVAGASSAEDVFWRLVSHWPEPTQLVRGAHAVPTLHTDPAAWPRTGGIVEHMMALDTVTYLPDDILQKVDRAAMSVSLETRIPLLDRAIVEFAATLPLSMLIARGASKLPLRGVLSRYVPPHLVDRPKAGFGLPIDDWLRGPLRSWSEERLFAEVSRNHLDGDLIARTWKEHLSGRRNHAYRLWDVLMFVEWADARGIG